MNLTRFEEFIAQRKRVLSFKPDVPQDELLLRLVTIAQRAPSLLNIQPTRYIFVKSSDVKEKILDSSWANATLRSAPMIVVFTGKRAVAFPEEDRKESFDLLFSHKPCGLGWLFKAICVPFLRLFSPTPELPAVHKKAWLYKEISLSAMSFITAAESAGLSTLMVDFFDERRVKKALGLPRDYVVPIVLAIGFPKDVTGEKALLPLTDIVFRK